MKTKMKPKKAEAKCKCRPVTKHLGPGMVQKIMTHRPTCAYKPQPDKVFARLAHYASIWEKPLALWSDIRTKMIQASFAAPKAVAMGYSAQQSNRITQLKQEFDRLNRQFDSDTSFEYCDDKLVKVVIRGMSKCEVQLILIAAIFKLRRAVQLRILKLFLEFIEKPDLLDYPYIQTVVGADTIPTEKILGSLLGGLLGGFTGGEGPVGMVS